MRVFVCGATGVLGRRVVESLRRNGHAVVALSRSEANAAWLSAHGAEPRVADLFDAGQVAKASQGCEAFLHLATAIPANPDAGGQTWLLNDRIRREGTANMVHAALETGAKFYLQQSIAFLYGDRSGEWVDEETPVSANPGGVLQSAADMERIVTEGASRGLPATTLRFGSFYSHDSRQTRVMLDLIRRRRFPLIRGQDPYWNSIMVDDAAAAVAAAVNHPEAARGQTFIVCDDEPTRLSVIVGFIASRIGARPPLRIPASLARVLTGSLGSAAMTASVRCRNQRIKEELGWRPGYSTIREGYPAVIDRWLKP